MTWKWLCSDGFYLKWAKLRAKRPKQKLVFSAVSVVDGGVQLRKSVPGARGAEGNWAAVEQREPDEGGRLQLQLVLLHDAD